ncbi:TPR domain-containing protein [Lophium mytilinum]|uniref:TPR domain-containing protein n=1 Tax=Lophium mytilinum TaxID=390894 RepID=A0A6A6QVQ2_9PEZI|nr:TPR domain-containing protein [Lophium mytilinum]
MAKTKPQDRSKRSRKTTNGTSKKEKPSASPTTLLAEATAALQTSQPELALNSAQRALSILQPTSTPTIASLPALTLLGEINVELGEVDTARELFVRAAALDPEGAVVEAQGGGAEKFLWLAQLCEEGGAESVGWFEKGAVALRRELGELEGKRGKEVEEVVEEKKRKLADALCGVAEVYMTDLSWEEDAEARCEALVTEALMVAPNNPEALQTLASVRISQMRLEDARAALTRSLDVWKDLEPEDPKVPEFPTKISLARLLMEAEMEDEAIEVLERLVGEDDGSVEAWYLGGWCLHLMGEKRKTAAESDEEKKTATSVMRASMNWLQNSLKLFRLLDYEDERLKEHAEELVQELEKTLGPYVEGEDGDEEEGWEDDDGSDDEEMDDT